MTFVVFANSCASFNSKYQVDQNVVLTKQNISKINMTFNSVPVLTVVKNQLFPKKIHTSDSLNLYNLSTYIKKNYESEIARKINTEQNIRILIRNNKEIIFYKSMNEELKDSIKFICKIKNDGFIYIKDSNFKIFGVPFIFGGFEINRRRLGLNKNEDLIFESTYYRYGAALIIIGDDRKVKMSSLFKVIK